MNHSTTRATILPEIIRKIMTHDHLSEDEALKAFYSSATGASFQTMRLGFMASRPTMFLGYIWKKCTSDTV